MKNTKNAFTLVELIVVITILAILGTIAFISLQGYSADARNSKRTSDIGNIQSAISLKQVEGVPLLSFVVNDTASNVDGLKLAGSGSYDSTKYAAGTPSYTVLNVVEKDFLDPKSDKAYRVGVTDERGGVFQVAATMEQDGTDTAAVNGTFVKRLSTDTGTVDSVDVSGSSITLNDNIANFFKIGDIVDLATSTGVTISKVSRDGVTLTLATAPVLSDTWVIHITNSESAGLIGDNNSTTAATGATAVENLSTTALAY